MVENALTSEVAAGQTFSDHVQELIKGGADDCQIVQAKKDRIDDIFSFRRVILASRRLNAKK